MGQFVDVHLVYIKQDGYTFLPSNTYIPTFSIALVTGKPMYNACFYVFLERREGREKEERNINVWLPLARPQLGTWPATEACALTGN